MLCQEHLKSKLQPTKILRGRELTLTKSLLFFKNFAQVISFNPHLISPWQISIINRFFFFRWKNCSFEKAICLRSHSRSAGASRWEPILFPAGCPTSLKESGSINTLATSRKRIWGSKSQPHSLAISFFLNFCLPPEGHWSLCQRQNQKAHSHYNHKNPVHSYSTHKIPQQEKMNN